MTGTAPRRFSRRANSKACSKAALITPTQAAPISAAVQLKAPLTIFLPSTSGAADQIFYWDTNFLEVDGGGHTGSVTKLVVDGHHLDTRRIARHRDDG